MNHFKKKVKKINFDDGEIKLESKVKEEENINKEEEKKGFSKHKKHRK